MAQITVAVTVARPRPLKHQCPSMGAMVIDGEDNIEVASW